MICGWRLAFMSVSIVSETLLLSLAKSFEGKRLRMLQQGEKTSLTIMHIFNACLPRSLSLL